MYSTNSSAGDNMLRLSRQDSKFEAYISETKLCNNIELYGNFRQLSELILHGEHHYDLSPLDSQGI